jgi:ornithine carbamoyltransferase
VGGVLDGLAAASSVPLINGLSDKSHPCQILADILTLEEHRGPVAGKVLAWIGDGNNVCSTYIHAAAVFGFELRIASPRQYSPDAADLARAAERQGRVVVTEDPREAVDGADCVMADTWVSMGDTDHDERIEAFEPFQVDERVMGVAAKGAVFLHCLPAHRGEEVTDAVIDGPQSVIWEEAENRIHAQKAVIAWCLGGVC